MIVIILALATLLAAFILVMPKAAKIEGLNGEVTVSGSAIMAPCMDSISQNFMEKYPDVAVSVSGLGTGPGYNDFLAGNAGMIMATSLPTTKQYADAAAAGKSFYMTIIGFDSVSVIVHPSNPLATITIAQLREIYYGGTITDWSQITNGEKTGPIHIKTVNSTLSGVASNFNKAISNGSTTFVSSMNYYMSIPEMTSSVANDTEALGFTSTGLVTSSVKAVSVNGITASPESVIDTSYPISFRLFLITDGVPTDESKSFINYVLSKDGQSVIQEAGLVPVI